MLQTHVASGTFPSGKMFLRAFNVFCNLHCGSECIAKNKAHPKTGEFCPEF
jgi:hypothetical protein